MVDEKSDFIFANNPFALVGEEWKQRRADITPGLTMGRVSDITIYIMDCFLQLVGPLVKIHLHFEMLLNIFYYSPGISRSKLSTR